MKALSILTALVAVNAFASSSQATIKIDEQSVAAATLATATTGKLDIIETAVAAGQFKTLAAALTAAGLIQTLKGPGPFTVFAPTDAAFAKLPDGTVAALLKDIPTLTSILVYHAVSGNLTPRQLVHAKFVNTINGKAVEVGVKGGKLFINQSQVVAKPIETSNGVIYVIDTVLLP